MEGSSKALKKGAWTAEEDTLLRQCIDKYGEGKWNLVPLRAGLNRCRKSCRLRWVNYLNPNINRGEFSSDEVDLLIRLHKLLGNRWSLIAGRLPERTANDVKNYWNTNLAKNYRCISNMRNRERPCSSMVPAPKHNVIRPQPQSFSNNNGWSSLNNLSGVGIRQVSTTYGTITSNKGKEKCDFFNNQMDGESMSGKRLLEVSQEEANAIITIDEEGDTSSIDSMSSTFENLESLFNAY